MAFSSGVAPTSSMTHSVVSGPFSTWGRTERKKDGRMLRCVVCVTAAAAAAAAAACCCRCISTHKTTHERTHPPTAQGIIQSIARPSLPSLLLPSFPFASHRFTSLHIASNLFSSTYHGAGEGQRFEELAYLVLAFHRVCPTKPAHLHTQQYMHTHTHTHTQCIRGGVG